MTNEELLRELENRITAAQQELIRTVGREAGSRMAGLEQAVFILDGLRKELE